MHILQLHNEYLYYGGEDTAIKLERELLIKNGHTVSQIIRKNENEISNIFSILKVIKNLSYSFDSIDILEKKFKNKPLPDIVHIHNIFPLWTYSVLDFFQKKNVPIVMTLHNYRLIWNKINPFDDSCIKYGLFKNSKYLTYIFGHLFNYKKNFLFKVNKFITFTNFTKKEILKSNIPKSRITIKPNFLIYKKVNIKSISKKNNAIFASRLSQEKGITTLVKAWENINLKLNVYGDGPLYPPYKEKKYKNIKFFGKKDRKIIQKQISNSKILIFPSEWYECMPMTILEAFNEGTLVVASNIGSIRNIIKNYKTGILFQSGNPIDLKNKIKWALNHPEKCDQIVLNAKKNFRDNYSDKVNSKLLINLYKKTINKKYKRN